MSEALRRRAALCCGCVLALAALVVDGLARYPPRRFSPSTRRRHLGSTALRAVKSDGYVSQGGSLGEEIGPLLRRPLLTKDDEQRFGHRVQTLQVIEARRAELTAARGGKKPSDAELAAACGLRSAVELRSTLESSLEAREMLILSNMRLVVNLARRSQRSLPRIGARGVDRDGGATMLGDLVAEGTLGLAKAVDRFEPQRGFRFSTYATWWVRQSIQRAVQKRSIIAVPVHVQQLSKVSANATRELYLELGRPPLLTELSARVGATHKQLILARRTALQPLSLDVPMGARGRAGSSGGAQLEGEMCLVDLVESTEPLPDEAASFLDLRQAIDYAMHDLLQPSERDVLRLRLGLDDGERRTRREIGEIFGTSEKSVRAIERSALRKLRAPHESADAVPLREYANCY